MGSSSLFAPRCAGCNVRPPWEHRCHGQGCPCEDCEGRSCECPECLSDRTVAALFVIPNGVYSGLLDVECWDEARDARLYAGPHPVVAHPPCARWSRLAGFVEYVHGYKRGDDGGCFAAALASVRAFGGVLEHPAYSKAWDHFNLPEPLDRFGWTGGLCGGFSAYVEQGRYGELPVKKATWLYAYGVELPELRWGYLSDRASDAANQNAHGDMDGWRDSWRPALKRGWRINEHRDGEVAAVSAVDGRMRGAKASTTPVEFRDVLLAIARTAKVVEVAA
jgi:hypothetical protein